MNVEIWTDIMCPFCYLGKKQFEKAVSQFSDSQSVSIEYKSFELNPEMSQLEERNLVDYLSESKQIEPSQVYSMFERITEQGKQEGIDFRFDIAQVFNSRKAHKLLQFSKEQGLQNELEEALFYAYFTLGKNLNDPNELDILANEIGLKFDSIQTIIEAEKYEEAVLMDNYQAQQVGARGVPFFVFENKYAVSGAQGVQTFLNVLETVKIKEENNNQ